MNYFNDVLSPIELPMLKEFHEAVGCGFLDAVMPAVSSLCKWGILWLVLTAVMLSIKKTRKCGVTVALALFIGLVVCNLTMKPLCARIRPYELDPTIVTLLAKETDFSFPSGHTIASFGAAVGIMMHSRRWGIPALILAVLIGFSRIYLMMHFFTDVIVSAVLGTVIGILSCYIGKIIIEKTKMPCD